MKSGYLGGKKPKIWKLFDEIEYENSAEILSADWTKFVVKENHDSLRWPITYLLIDLRVILALISVSANQQRELMEGLLLDWLQAMISQGWLWGRIVDML